jgi:hypothetical protein
METKKQEENRNKQPHVELRTQHISIWEWTKERTTFNVHTIMRTEIEDCEQLENGTKVQTLKLFLKNGQRVDIELFIAKEGKGLSLSNNQNKMNERLK